MNFDQIIIREFLKLNPVFTDTPELLAQKRVGALFTGAVNFPRTEEATVTGGKVVSANVPDLAMLFRNITPEIEIYKPTTNRDVAQVLFSKYGIAADINEITATAISYDPLPLEVEIVASATGKTITGRIKVKLTQKVMDLTEIITESEHEAVVDLYPTAGVDNFVPIKYYYGADCTEWRDVLKGIPVVSSGWGHIYDTVTKFLDIVNDPRWNCPIVWERNSQSTRSPYALNDCYTPYNGLTTGYPGANTNYTHVLVINARYATAITPTLFLLHYNWRP